MFSEYKDLYHHVKYFHERIRNYECSYCDAKFQEKSPECSTHPLKKIYYKQKRTNSTINKKKVIGPMLFSLSLSLSLSLSFKNSLDSWLGQKAAVQSRTEYPSRREDKVSRLSQGHQHWQLLKVWQVLRISALNFLEIATSLCEPVGWSVSWSVCQNILKEREVILDKCSYRSTYKKYWLAYICLKVSSILEFYHH